MRKGDPVLCVDAKDWGILIEEGQVYTVRSTFREVPEWGGKAIPGCTLVEVPGRYFQSRFMEVQ